MIPALKLFGLVCLASLLHVPPAAEGATWSTVAPRVGTLPNGEPPSSFERRENTVLPVGVSNGLDERPALLHSNKFYSNFLVSVDLSW